MCKIGDIILIDEYISQGTLISKHSFVVIDDDGDVIHGLPYDFVCNVLSSFKNPAQRKRKLSYPGNFPISAEDISVPGGNKKEGYIKADQFYYFKKSNINYKVIGIMTVESFNELIDFISEGDFETQHITDNL